MNPPAPLTRDALLEAFKTPLKPHRPSGVYKLGMALICLMMLLLPLAYLGLIGLVAWAVVYHVAHNSPGSGQRTTLGTLLVYFGPVVGGLVLILFMVKPLFARREKAPVPVSLAPADAPLLFDLVRALCESIGAPVPRRIDVDGQANASASLRRGLLSFFGHDLLLTIGMPLVAGLSLRNFVGVLSHEFGHFAQGTGMRATYLVRSINLWFARLVYERDGWDEGLESASKGIDLRIGIFIYAIRLCIWLTRRILWVLMHLGHAVSMFMLRQMEYDADQYEIQVAGSRSFTETARALPILSVAHHAALGTLQESWNERRLGDNLPRLVLEMLQQMPEDLRKEIRLEQMKGKGGAYDTHPPDQRRIDRAIREQAPGTFTLEAPATLLFADFDAVARRVTAAFYRRVLGRQFSEKNLVRTEELVEQERAQKGDQESLRRGFRGFLLGSELPFLPDEAAQPPADEPAAIQELESVRERVPRGLDGLARDLKTLEEAEERVRMMDRLELCVRAQLRFKAADFGLTGTDREDLALARKPAQARREDSLQRVRPALDGAVRRVVLGLRLARTPNLAPDGVAPGELDRLLAALGALGRAYPEFRRMMDAFDAASILLNSVRGNEQNASLFGQINAASMRWEKALSGLKKALGETPYPFEHAKGRVSLGQFVVGTVPSHDDIGGTIGAVQETAGRYYAVYSRMLGRMTRIVEQVEKALKLPALPEPPKEA